MFKRFLDDIFIKLILIMNGRFKLLVERADDFEQLGYIEEF